MSHFTPQLIGDYQFDEVTSALQKSIRRSLEYEAAYWGYLIHQSGYGMYLFRRLMVITCEDVGNGTSDAPVVISSLQQAWLLLHKQNKENTLDKFLLALQAILYLCRAKKCRENDNLANLIEENYKSGKRLEVQSWAIDSHCSAGKAQFGNFGNLKDGKEKIRLDKWFNEGAYIENVAYQDKWEEEIKQIWYSRVPQETKKDK